MSLYTPGQETVPSLLSSAAMMCVAYGLFKKSTCKAIGDVKADLKDDCDELARISYPIAAVLMCLALACCMCTMMGLMSRGSMMGGGMGYGGYPGF